MTLLKSRHTAYGRFYGAEQAYVENAVQFTKWINKGSLISIS
jgi:hypothetical protein